MSSSLSFNSSTNSYDNNSAHDRPKATALLLQRSSLTPFYNYRDGNNQNGCSSCKVVRKSHLLMVSLLMFSVILLHSTWQQFSTVFEATNYNMLFEKDSAINVLTAVTNFNAESGDTDVVRRNYVQFDGSNNMERSDHIGNHSLRQPEHQDQDDNLEHVNSSGILSKSTANIKNEYSALKHNGNQQVVDIRARHKTSFDSNTKTATRTRVSPPLTKLVRPTSHSNSSLKMSNLLIDLDDNTTFTPTSACILFCDDDQRLVEWLAYHYYTAGLRTLVVATSPLSSSKPTSILDRWRPYMHHVVEWSDADFGFEATASQDNFAVQMNQQHTPNHRKRQPAFYRACIEYLQKLQLADQNKTNTSNKNSATNSTDDNSDGWTWFHDPDEYVTLNNKLVPNASKYMAQPSGLLKAWKHSRVDAKLEQKSWLFELPSDANKNTTNTTAACYSIPRLLVSVKGSVDEFNRTENGVSSVIDTGAPALLDTSHFETIKYRFRVPASNVVVNGHSKCLLDVGRVKLFPNNTVKVHRVTKNECPRKTPKIIFVINHYLSSWRLYARPTDERRIGARSWQAWQYRSELGIPNDTIQPWLQSFVEHVGTDLAKILLKPVPPSPAYSRPIIMSEWMIPPEMLRNTTLYPNAGFRNYADGWLQRYDEAVAIANRTNRSKPLFIL